MKILMIAPQPFLEPRGTPISVYQRLQGLSRLKFQVDLLTYHLGEDVDLPGVNIYRTPRVPFIRQLKVGPSWTKLPLDFLLFVSAVTLLLKNRYDVIHSHEEAAFFSAILAAVFRIPHLYDMHSSLPRQLVNFNFGNYRPIVALFEILERWVIKTCDALITIGPDLAAHAEKIHPGVNQMMIENLPLQADGITRPDPTTAELTEGLNVKDRTTIVYTGTFERYQGVELLIRSTRIVSQRHPQVIVILVGGNPQQVEAMKQLVGEYDLNNHVIFTGTVPMGEANRYLDMADILVSPRVEGTSVPLKIYSYLNAGKPIVATDLPAHNLLLNQETALLVPPDEGALAQALLELIHDLDLRLRLSSQARKLAEEKHSFASYVSNLEKIYRTLRTARVPAEQTIPTLEN